MNKTTTMIQKKLIALQDEKYRDFHSKLMPTIDANKIIGVRVPALRRLAKELAGELTDQEIKEFMDDLPHRYYEENNLHAFMIEGIGDFDRTMKAVNDFLPFVDNWATCDSMSPKVFKKHLPEMQKQIEIWIDSNETYTVRFAIGMLMKNYLDEAFQTVQAERVAAVKNDDYYIKMMVAWYFATALAKQREAIMPFFEQRRLEVWTHNKAIQKCIESYRISDKDKEYLRTLKIK